MGFWQHLTEHTRWGRPGLGIGGLGHALLKSACPCCQRPSSEILCPDCQRQLQTQQLPDFKILNQTTLPVLAWGYYGGPLKRVIAALKYQQQRPLGPFLGQLLASAWLSPRRQQLSWCQQASLSLAKSPAKSLVVIPIPLHLEKLNQRGFNQADLIAQGFCYRTNLPLLCQGLTRCRATTPQFGLTDLERQQNLANAFEIGPDLQSPKGQNLQVLLLDDIFTTGATIRAASQILEQVGISVYGSVTVAITPKEL
jgi:ComF family protein